MSHDLTQYQSPEDGFDGGYASMDAMGRDVLPPPPPAWQRYLSAVLRRKWIILIVTLIGTAAGVFATRFVQLTYRAETRLWVQADQGPNQGPIRDAQLLESTGWLDLLRASTVLEPVVKEHKLFVTPTQEVDRPIFERLDIDETARSRSLVLQVSGDGREVSLLDQSDAVLDRVAMGDSIGRELGLQWVPPASQLAAGQRVQFYITGLHDSGQALARRLVPALSSGQSFLLLSMQGRDPQQVATILNAVAERFVQVAADLKRANLVELTGILEEQLDYADRALGDAQVALEGFRVNTITLPSQQAAPVAAGLAMTRDPVYDNYFDLRVRRQQLQEHREGIERILQEARTSSTALDALITFPAVPQGGALSQALEERMVKRSQLRTDTLRYTANYPTVQALLGEIQTLEEVTIPALARELMSSLASQEVEAEGRIGTASSELREIPPRAMAEAGLQREVAIAQDLHTRIKQRYEEARLASAGSVPDIRVLDPAVAPNYPTSDSRRTMMAMGLLGSFGLALVGVILLDRLDPKVRYPEQLTHEMGLPIIGMVPHLKSKTGLFKGADLAEASEAFREIRLSLLHAYGSAGPVFFTVSSAEPGDGKSFMVANLAVAFSQQGYRTLVIDGDIRRGRLHALLGGQRAPGLTDYLAGRVSQSDVFQSTEHPNVSLIGSGTRVDVGPELLGSAAMGELTKHAKSRFDVIIIDSPPLGAGIDPYVLGTVSGNMMLVFRTGNTNRSFAQSKLGLIDRLPIRVLGAVLNDVPGGGRLYQAYSYLPGYEAATERGVDWAFELAGPASEQSASLPAEEVESVAIVEADVEEEDETGQPADDPFQAVLNQIGGEVGAGRTAGRRKAAGG